MSRFLSSLVVSLLLTILVTDRCQSQPLAIAPRPISNTEPILHYRADSGLVVSKGKVVSWKNMTGNASLSAGQPDHDLAPEVGTNTINGRPTVHFAGWEYMIGPSLFPEHRDYTILAVVHLGDTTIVNNILSGDNHAFYFRQKSAPEVLHGDFYTQATAWHYVGTNPALVVINYREETQQATCYVNGVFSDSGFVRANEDSIIYLGSFLKGYFLKGDIAELALYNRDLDSLEREELMANALQRYGISRFAPIPPPDSTFTVSPAPLQLYSRGSDDSATVPITGTMNRPGFDTIRYALLKNGTIIQYAVAPLTYKEGKAPFGHEFRIHAELSEYSVRVVVHAITGYDSSILHRDSIVAGDVYLISGQSNITFGFDSTSFLSEFARTFGFPNSQLVKDTVWNLSVADKWGNGQSVGAIGLSLQQLLLEREHVPTCLIEAGLSGTNIEYHLRNNSNPMALNSVYGRFYYRMTKSHLLNRARAMFWFQGELNTLAGYDSNFRHLYSDWQRDFLGQTAKFYLIQLRPGWCVNLDSEPLRDWQRRIQDQLPNIETVASAAISLHDGCHWTSEGYHLVAERFFDLLERDCYHNQDTLEVRSPAIRQAFYTTPLHDEIAFVFSPRDTKISWTSDTTSFGFTENIMKYIYLDRDTNAVTSIRSSNDTLYVGVAPHTTYNLASYMPDRYYNLPDAGIFEGPWIVNSRGVGALAFWHFPIAQIAKVDPVHLNTVQLISPQPCDASCTIIVDNTRTSRVNTITVVNSAGQTLRTVNTVPQINEITLDTSKLPNGLYFARLTGEDATQQCKLVVLHR